MIFQFFFFFILDQCFVLFDFSVRLNYFLVVPLTYIIDFFYMVFVEKKMMRLKSIPNKLINSVHKVSHKI